jgi:hypothetical protein
VQNFVGKEVGQGGQGVDKVGHPHWGGRRPRSNQRSATVGRQRRATAGRAEVARQATAGWASTRRPAVAGPPTAALGGRRPPVGRRPRVAACTGCDCGCCAIFFYLFSEKKGDIFFSFFFRPLHVARAWTSCGGVCTVSHFLKCAPTLGSANSSKIHGEWRFHFFPNFVFPKFTSYMDLHIYRWDFCFMKKLIP